MKKYKFIVELEFDESLKDDIQINEVSDNIARALYNEVDGGIGLVPECEHSNFTKSIKVINEFTDYISEKDINWK